MNEWLNESERRKKTIFLLKENATLMVEHEKKRNHVRPQDRMQRRCVGNGKNGGKKGRKKKQ